MIQQHIDVVVELAQISKWKHLDYDIMTMRNTLYDQFRKNEGSYALLKSPEYHEKMTERYIRVEQCISDVIESAMFPYK